MADRDLLIRIKTDSKKAIADINKLQSEVKTLSSQFKRGANVPQFNNQLKSLTGTVRNVVGAFAAFQGIRSAVTTLGSFESAIIRVKAISGATEQEFKSLREEALRLGETTTFSATESAQAMDFLGRAGFNTNEILESTTATLDLARIGNLDLARAADIASDSVTAFGLEAKDTERVIDVFAKTITSSNTNVEQLGSSFSKVAPVASSLGISLEETSASLGVLADAGIKAELAGTQLKISLNRIATDKTAQKALKGLGVEAFDIEGNFRNLAEILKDLNPALNSLDQQSRQIALKNIFGSEAIAAGTTLVNNADKIISRTKELNEANGTAKKLADEFNKSLESQYKELGSAIEGLILSFSDDLIPVLKDVLSSTTETVRGFTKWSSENKQVIKSILTLTAELTALFFVFKGMSTVIAATRTATASFSALRIAIAGITALNPAFLVLVASIVAVEAALGSLNKEIEDTNNATNKLNESTDDFSSIFDSLQKSLDDNGSFKLTKEEIKDLDGSMRDLIKTNQKKIFELSNKDATKFKREIELLSNQNDTLIKGLGKLKTITPYEELTKDAGSYTEVVQSLSDEEISKISKVNTERRKQHATTINTLITKEQELKDKVLSLQQDLKDSIENINRQRVSSLESIDSRIREINRSQLSESQQYHDKQREAEESLSKAKKALRDGDLKDYERYSSKYEQLITDSAGKAITEDGKVKVSAEQTRRASIQGLQNLKSLEDNYYKQKVQQEENAYNKKIQLVQAEIKITMSKLKAEQEQLKITIKLLEAITGKSIDIDIDTKSGQDALRDLQKQYDDLEDQKIPDKEQKVEVKADTKDADEKIKETSKDTKSEHTVIPEVEYIQRTIEDIKEGTESTHFVNPNTNEIEFTIDKIKKNTSSTHTIFVKKVQQNQLGGYIENWNTGGLSGSQFKKRSGSLGGYGGGDKIPSMLEAGEFIIRKEAVKAIGINELYRLNNVRKYATGGLVTGTDQKDYISSAELQDLDLSGLEDLLRNFDELKAKIKDISGITDSQTRGTSNIFEGLKDEISNLRKDISSFSVRESSINSSIKNAKNQNETDKALTDFDRLQLDKDSKQSFYASRLASYDNTSSNLRSDIQKYSNSLESVKSSIKRKLEDLGVTYNGWQDSKDLDRLNKFKNGLDNLNSDDINRQARQIAEQNVQTRIKQLESTRLQGFGGTTGSQFVSSSRQQEEFRSLQQELKDLRSQPLDKKIEEQYKRILANRLPKFQTGGKLGGYGGGDRNLALLEDGEFVVRKEAVRHFGDGFLSSVNNMQLPKFQTGGLVDISSNNSPTSSYNINIQDNGKDVASVQTQSIDVVKTLENYLRTKLD